MKQKTAFAVFSYTLEGNEEYMVKGNFGGEKELAETWAKLNQHLYSRTLFVKEIKY